MESQLQMGPWSGFVQTHLWLLWGNDQFENMLQWSAMVGCLVIATLLVRQVLPAGPAASPRAQASAALLVVTLPTGIVESITTQTDYTTGFWLMSLASLALAWFREPGNRAYASGFGAVLGLGMLTKFTMLIYGAPVGVAAAAALLWNQRKGVSPLFLPGTSALTICLALVLPHFIRNQMVFGSTIGSQSSLDTAGIAHPSPGGILFNVIHNTELHSNTGIPALTHQLNQLAHAFESWTGRRPDDPELSFQSSKFALPGMELSGAYAAPDEFFICDSFAPSAWHVGLIGLAAVSGLLTPRKNRLALVGMGLAFAGFVLFCAALRWQIWGSRYHLPALLLFMPLVATLLVPRTSRWLTDAAGAGLLIFGIVIVANNSSRPIFDPAWRAQPRLEQLLAFHVSRYYQPMRAVVGQIMAAGCVDVGLKFSNEPEYAFWLMLREAGFKGEIHHQIVEGPSSRLPGPLRLPDVIVTTLSGGPVGTTALRFPTRTEIAPFTLHWSAKISQKRAQGAM